MAEKTSVDGDRTPLVKLERYPLQRNIAIAVVVAVFAAGGWWWFSSGV